MCEIHTIGFNSHCSLASSPFVRLVVSLPRHVHYNLERHPDKILILDSSGWTAQWTAQQSGRPEPQLKRGWGRLSWFSLASPLSRRNEPVSFSKWLVQSTWWQQHSKLAARVSLLTGKFGQFSKFKVSPSMLDGGIKSTFQLSNFFLLVHCFYHASLLLRVSFIDSH